MQHTLKRALALLLSLAMVLSLMSTGAWATETEDEPPESEVVTEAEEPAEEASTETEEATETEEPSEAEAVTEAEEPAEPEVITEAEEPAEPEVITEAEEPAEAEEVTEAKEVTGAEVIPEAPEVIEELPDAEVEEEVTEEALNVGDPVASVTSGGTTTNYATFDAALDKWVDGSTLTLLADIERDTYIAIEEKTVTLDLNGHGIRVTTEGTDPLLVTNEATLTLCDSTPGTSHKYRQDVDGFATVSDEGNETFTGGYITGGACSTGGAVYVNGATFIMQGGTILGNYATSDGGGVYLEEDASFTMEGGSIFGNYSSYCGGGVYVGNGCTFTLKDGAISENYVYYDYYDEDEEAYDYYGSGGGVYVGEKASFTMKGGEISRNIAGGDDGGGVNVYSGGTFLMQGGSITGNYSADDGGGVALKNGGSFTMEGGEIADNDSEDTGGGVYLYHNSTFTMKNGTSITGNTSYYGGGIFVEDGSNCIIEGGSITGNTAKGWGEGGGVYVDESSFDMKGGEISGNNAICGGGVYMDESSFNMKGGRISGNNAQYGGGIFVYALSNASTVTLTDSYSVSGNTASKLADNAALAGRGRLAVFTLVSLLNSAAPVGVTALRYNSATDDYEACSAVITSGWKETMGETADPAQYFVSENERYQVVLNGEGEVLLSGEDSHQHHFTFALAEGKTDTIVATCANEDGKCPLENQQATLTISAPTMTTYGQTGEGISPEAVITDPEGISTYGDVYYYPLLEGRIPDEEKSTRTPPTDIGAWRAIIVPWTTDPASGDDDKVTAYVDYTISSSGSVLLTPAEKQIVYLGSAVPFIAEVDLPELDNKQVIWSVEGDAVALYTDPDCATPVGTEATNTLAVYVKGMAEGSATVTVTSAADGAKSAFCTVTVPTGVPIGNRDTTNALLPTFVYFNYSLSQQIYTAEEVGPAGDIRAISFYYNSNTRVKRDLSVYLRHTDKTSLSGRRCLVPMTEDELFFSGKVVLGNAGWVRIVLDKPFAYNGKDNLLLCVADNTGDWERSQPFAVSDTETCMAAAIYSDVQYFNVQTVSNLPAVRCMFRNVIQLEVTHRHDFTYTAKGATITAKCVNDGYPCDITEGLTLTLTAPTELTYDSKVKAATLNEGYNTELFPDVTIVYTKDSKAVTEAKDAGKYTASVTVGGATAKVNFTIEQKEVSLKWSGTKFTYDKKSHVPKVTVTGMVKGDKCSATVTGAQKNAGKYTAKVTKLSNANYKLPSKASVSFTIAKAAQSAPKAPVVTKVTGTSITVKVVKGQQYRISGGGKWQTSGTFKNLKLGTKYTIFTRKPGDANHLASPTANTKARTLSAAMVMQSGTKIEQNGSTITVKWAKAPGAKSYDVYIQYCGEEFDSEPTATVKGNSVNITKIAGKAIDTSRNYKVYIVAKNGSKVLGKTKDLHGVASGRTGRLSDAKSVSVKKAAFSLSKGKSVNLGATVQPKSGQLSTEHGAILRYVTSDSSVASVDKNGKVTAKGVGVCVIEAIAMNGISKSVTVTVK